MEDDGVALHIHVDVARRQDGVDGIRGPDLAVTIGVAGFLGHVVPVGGGGAAQSTQSEQDGGGNRCHGVSQGSAHGGSPWNWGKAGARPSDAAGSAGARRGWRCALTLRGKQMPRLRNDANAACHCRRSTNPKP